MNTMVPPVPLEEVACPLCGGADNTLEYTAEDSKYGLPGKFGIVRCRVCGLVYTSPRPSPADMGAFYPSGYLPHQPPSDSAPKRWLRAFRKQVFGGPKSHLTAFLGFVHNSLSFRSYLHKEADSPKVLDIGCGSGEYLATWRALGWQIEGVEMNSEVAASVRARLGIAVHGANVEALDLPEANFDLITMCHSLEHTFSPRLVLGRVHRWLKPGGRVLVMVPNYDSFDRWMFGGRWLALEPPRHLVHFDRRSVTALLEAEGFRIETAGASQPDMTIRNLLPALVRTKAGTSTDAYKAFCAMLFAPVALLGKSSALWVVARKEASDGQAR
jgi:SAM-dependent methyltransferase